MLVCENLSLVINQKTIFTNLSFSCFGGCFLYLKGKNGSGKTSLLRMIAGIQKFDTQSQNSYSYSAQQQDADLNFQNPETAQNRIIQSSNVDINSSGKILINSQPITHLKKPFSLYVGHKNGIRPELSVIDNLIFWAKIYNSELMLGASIYYWKLQDILNEKCYKLSAGNTRKVSLARLMCCSSGIWLLDEVDVNLDEENRNLLFNSIKIKIESGGIVLFSSHSIKIGDPNIDLDLFILH